MECLRAHMTCQKHSTIWSSDPQQVMEGLAWAAKQQILRTVLAKACVPTSSRCLAPHRRQQPTYCRALDSKGCYAPIFRSRPALPRRNITESCKALICKGCSSAPPAAGQPRPGGRTAPPRMCCCRPGTPSGSPACGGWASAAPPSPLPQDCRQAHHGWHQCWVFWVFWVQPGSRDCINAGDQEGMASVLQVSGVNHAVRQAERGRMLQAGHGGNNAGRQGMASQPL